MSIHVPLVPLKKGFLLSTVCLRVGSWRLDSEQVCVADTEVFVEAVSLEIPRYFQDT